MHISAPGKAILFGEHAVVYNHHAVASAIDLRLHVIGHPSVDRWLRISVPALALSREFPIDDIVAATGGAEALQSARIAELLEAESGVSRTLLQVVFLLYPACYEKQPKSEESTPLSVGAAITVNSDIPIGAGLGSSAALAVALSTYFHIHFGLISPSDIVAKKSETLAMINLAAFEAEKVVHGTPSGLDNYLACYGGTVMFRKHKITRNTEFGATSLQHTERMLIVNTGVPRSTRTMVDDVRQLLEDMPKCTSHIMESIGAISIEYAFLKRHIKSNLFPKLVTMNRQLLGALGVSHPAIETVYQLADDFGFAAKLTGAGGGGCVLVFVPEESTPELVDSFAQRIALAGMALNETTLGAPGVAIHEHN